MHIEFGHQWLVVLHRQCQPACQPAEHAKMRKPGFSKFKVPGLQWLLSGISVIILRILSLQQLRQDVHCIQGALHQAKPSHRYACLPCPLSRDIAIVWPSCWTSWTAFCAPALMLQICPWLNHPCFTCKYEDLCCPLQIWMLHAA